MLVLHCLDAAGAIAARTQYGLKRFSVEPFKGYEAPEMCCVVLCMLTLYKAYWVTPGTLVIMLFVRPTGGQTLGVIVLTFAVGI